MIAGTAQVQLMILIMAALHLSVPVPGLWYYVCMLTVMAHQDTYMEQVHW